MCKIMYLNSFSNTVTYNEDVTWFLIGPDQFTHLCIAQKTGSSGHTSVCHLRWPATDPLRDIPSQPKPHYPHTG